MKNIWLHVIVNDNIIIIYNNIKNQSFHSFYIKAPKYVKQTPHVLKGKVDKSKIILGDVNTHF